MCLELETPIEAILRMAWAEVRFDSATLVWCEISTANTIEMWQPALGTAIRVAIELHLFEKLKGGSSFQNSSSSLAAMAGADSTLLSML